MSEKPLLSVRGLKKSFGEVQALRNIDFTLKAGEIHALCGGNGAGKSTFLSIVMGFLQPDVGTIEIEGKPQVFANARAAMDAGITIVQQELSMIPHLSVAENIFLGQEPRKSLGRVDFATLNSWAKKLLDELDFAIKPTEKVINLSVAEQQLVEIAKALSRSNAQIIILDEPTSAIGEEDAQKLFKAIKTLAAKGKGIIYVSHRLSEIFSIATNYTIFRDGTFIQEGSIESVTREELIEHIIGGEIDDEFSKYNICLEKDVLQVDNICGAKFKDISFTSKAGEILGIYGLVGSGRSEVLNAIFGIDAIDSGTIRVNNKKLAQHEPADSIAAGMAYVTEDRKNTGLVLSSSVGENMVISSLSSMANKFSIIEPQQEKTNIAKMIELFKIKTPHGKQLVKNLSGGNQQKVVLGRWSLTEPDLLLLDEPTRGIDVGAKKEIYKYMSEQGLAGKSIVMVSSELAEIIGMSDRILVFKNGEIVAEVPQAKASQKLLLSLAS